MVVISERFLLANLLYFSFTYFFNSLTIQVKFHEVPEYIILYSRIELLQPESLTENKKKTLRFKTTRPKQSFSSDIITFLTEER